MTYDEAVKALDAMHSGAHATSEQMLDAIGYRQMRWELDWFHCMLMTRFEPATAATLHVGDPTMGRVFTDEWRMKEQRDAARELADQLATALHEVIEDEPVGLVEGDKYHDTDWYGASKCGCSWDSGPYPTWCGRHNPQQHAGPALKAYDARDWKPTISPPGSGLDGLLADINRSDP